MRQHGFSLTETLLAVATLAIGMMFIGGTFLTGIYFATVSTERTIAAVAADEAFAKVRLYGLDPNDPALKTDAFVPYDEVHSIPTTELFYPSTQDTTDCQYSWAALCKRADASSRLVQFTIFVCRRTGANVQYWVRQDSAGGQRLLPSDLPRPVRVTIAHNTASQAADELTVVDAITTDAVDERAFINEGAFLVDDATGQIHRVLERYADRPDTVELDRSWAGGATGAVWVIPPAATSGRNPVAAVYQETMRF